MTENQFETLRENVVKRMSASHTSNSNEDLLATALIEDVSKIVVEILKEYEKLKS